MADIPFTLDARREILEQARDFYERVLGQVENDPVPRRQLAWIYQKLGHIAWCSGSPDGEPALRRSIAILENLAQQFANDPEARVARLWSHYWLAFCIHWDLRFAEEIPEIRASIALAEGLVAQFPTNDEYREALACAEAELGGALAAAGQLDEAEQHCRAALAAGQRLSAWARVRTRNDLSFVLMALGRFDEAQQVLQEALQIAEREMAPDASPGHKDFGKNIKRLAFCHHLLGLHLFYTARLKEAERHVREAIDSFQRLSGVYPVNVHVPLHQGQWHHDLAEILTAMGRLEEAEAARRQSLAACESAVTAATAIFPQGKGLAHYRLAELLHATGRTDEARRHFDQAQAIMEELARCRPKEPDCHWQLICLLANCPEPALRDPPRAVALAKRVLPPSAGHYWRYLALRSTAASSGKTQPTRSSKRWICARAATRSTGCCWR